MLPQSQPRKKRNSSKVNLMISFIFHAVLVVVLFYFAARSGMLGNQLKKITIRMVKEQKPPPKPKPPPPPPKIEPPKAPPKVVQAPKVVEAPKVMAPPPVVAPPATVLPALNFGDGQAVATSSDPVELYKGALQYAFQSKWNRPDNINDDSFVDEIQVSVSRDGQISDPQWEKSSGNAAWDESVRKAIEAVTSMERPPPTNFPPTVVIRFDVQEESETLLQ